MSHPSWNKRLQNRIGVCSDEGWKKNFNRFFFIPKNILPSKFSISRKEINSRWKRRNCSKRKKIGRNIFQLYQPNGRGWDLCFPVAVYLRGIMGRRWVRICLKREKKSFEFWCEYRRVTLGFWKIWPGKVDIKRSIMKGYLVSSNSYFIVQQNITWKELLIYHQIKLFYTN